MNVAPITTRRVSSTTSCPVPVMPSPSVAAADVSSSGSGHDAHVETALARLRLGEAHRADLRVGERDARDHVVVGDVARGLAEDHVADEPALVLAHVREQGAAVAVADRVEPVPRDAAARKLVVDLDELAGFEADGVEPEVAGRRSCARPRTRISSPVNSRPSSSVATTASPSRRTRRQLDAGDDRRCLPPRTPCAARRPRTAPRAA